MASYSQKLNLYLPSRNDTNIEVDTSLTDNFNKIDTNASNVSSEFVEATGYGIINGLTVSAQSTPNMTVFVSGGTVHMPDGSRYSPLSGNVTIATADSTKPRTDIVYVNNTGSLSYLESGLGTAAIAGSRSYTITGNAVVNDTVAINGVTFTAVSGNATGNQFLVGATTTDTATNLTSTLNGNATINATYNATSSTNVITLTEKTAGDENTPTVATTTGTIGISSGTATTSTAQVYPSSPITPSGGVELAEIKVGAGVSSIVSSNITDKRLIKQNNNQIVSQLADIAINLRTPPYNADNTGVQDCTDAINSALNALKTTGGKLFFPSGTYLINGQINLPDNQATTNPTQPSIIFEGVGASNNGRGLAPSGGTILDMRYSGTYGKIVSLGLGYFEAKNITFADFGTDTLPFIYSTYTTPHIHDCEFYGTGNQQDAIILGGTTDSEGPRGYDVGFQGYSAIIRDNYFGKIRRAVYGRVYFNGNVISGNTIWSTCGSNLADGAAIDIDGDPNNTGGQSSTGNLIMGNLIEVSNYPYGIRLNKTINNSIMFNNMYDATSITLGHIIMGTGAQYNHIIAGTGIDSKPFVVNDDGSNTIQTSHQSMISYFPQPMQFSNGVTIKNQYPNLVLEDTSNNQAFHQLEAGNQIVFYIKPNGQSQLQMAFLKNFGSNIFGLTMVGSDNRIDSYGELRIMSASGHTLWLGDDSNPSTAIYITGGVLHSSKAIGTAPFVITSTTPVDNLTVKRINNGTLIASGDSVYSGAQLFTGTGSPEGVVTADVGSLYTRTDGGTGTTLYVKESGAGNTGWIAK